LNSTLDEEQEQIVVKKYYNIGIATATEEGLIVPVLKAADRRTLVQLSREISRLSEAARRGTIALEDLKEGTFTITSLGALGGLLATPVINYPEVAILGVHKISQRPAVVDGKIVVRDMMNLSLSLDHRVVDGAVGAQFMSHIIPFMENPALLLFSQ
jgi:pyruvate dehydrogenase E2 component (dihydrolipoamide acetyltransferase)